MWVPPRRAVLAGGGIRVIAHIGALKALQEAKLLHHIREWVGVSAGALICFLFCVGYELPEVEHVCKKLDFGIVRNFEPEDALEYFENYGLDNGLNLDKFLCSLLRIKKLPTTLTFSQIEQRFKKSLRMYATDINVCQPIEFSVKKTPNMPIIVALRASMCLPFYFKPVMDTSTGHLWIDGGVMGNYPICHLTPEEAEESIGLCFNQSESVVENFTSFWDFCGQIMATHHVPNIRRIVQEHVERTIIIPCGEYPAINFEASQEDREKLLLTGYNAAKDFIKNGHKQRPKGLRRYSVS